jgi:hypothetical protein
MTLVTLSTSFAYTPNQANLQLNLARLTIAHATPSLANSQSLSVATGLFSNILSFDSTPTEQSPIAAQIIGLINTASHYSPWEDMLLQSGQGHKVQLQNGPNKYHYVNAWWKPQACYRLRRPTSLMGFETGFSNQ